MSKEHYLGGCLCGAVRFRARGVPLKPHTCSCSQCQRHSGALTLSWVEYPKDAVEWTGTGGMPALYRSSDYSSRAFCPQCGSTVGAIDDAPVVALAVGGFDDKDGVEMRPDYHAHNGAWPAWWTFGGGS